MVDRLSERPCVLAPPRSRPLEELLTIVLVTSPVPSNPSTEMLEWTLQSYVEKAGLSLCAKIIISDGFTVAGKGQRERPKSGRVPAEWVAPYAQFRDRLDALIANGDLTRKGADCITPSVSGSCGVLGGSAGSFSNCKHMRMEQHKGFGGCTYCALRLVTTPYVLVLQHDRPCLRTFEAYRVVATMEASQGLIKYIGLPTKASLARVVPDAIMSRCHFRLDADAVDTRVVAAAATSGIELQVLLFWYDSSHVCQVSHYRDFVFAKGRVPGGGFPEDSFGQAMHADICSAAKAGRWRESHAAYGTYLLDDGYGPMVGHVRGRRYVDAAELRQNGWTGHCTKAAEQIAAAKSIPHVGGCTEPLISTDERGG